MALIKVGNSLLKSGSTLLQSTGKSLPSGMLLLDYFIDGYRLMDSRMTMNIPEYYITNNIPTPTSTGYIPNENTSAGTTYFNFEGTAFDRMPYGYFDGPATPTAYIYYSGFSDRLRENGSLSLEFLTRLDTRNTGRWVHELFGIVDKSGYCCKLMPTYEGNFVYFAYSPGSSGWSWNNGYYIQSPSVGYNNNNVSWNHWYFNLTVSGNYTSVVTFSNGKRICGPYNVYGIMDSLRLPCTQWEANGIGSDKVGAMQFAQVAIYDHIEHTENFTVPRVPLLWL